MIKFEKVNERSKSSVEEACALVRKIYYEIYDGILQKSTVKYILRFVVPEIVKKELKKQNEILYFIKNNNETTGFIRLRKNSTEYFLSDFHILKEKQKQNIAKTAFEEFLKIENNISIFIQDFFESSKGFFEKFNYVKSDRIAFYIGSKQYFYGYLYKRDL